MKIVRVTYTTKPEYVEHNQSNIKKGYGGDSGN